LWLTYVLFAWLISQSEQTNNQPAVLFSQNKPAPTISHQSNEQVVSLLPSLLCFMIPCSHEKFTFKICYCCSGESKVFNSAIRIVLDLRALSALFHACSFALSTLFYGHESMKAQFQDVKMGTPFIFQGRAGE
jgi:hypothetical protein